jgi:hypothetical protein
MGIVQIDRLVVVYPAYQGEGTVVAQAQRQNQLYIRSFLDQDQVVYLEDFGDFDKPDRTRCRACVHDAFVCLLPKIFDADYS